jgi:hypothetical protein
MPACLLRLLRVVIQSFSVCSIHQWIELLSNSKETEVVAQIRPYTLANAENMCLFTGLMMAGASAMALHCIHVSEGRRTSKLQSHGIARGDVRAVR